MRIQVLTVASMKVAAFWDTVLFSLIEIGLHFRGALEAVCTSETSGYFNETTWHYIPNAAIFNAYVMFCTKVDSHWVILFCQTSCPINLVKVG
jgi:hypothetical protein